MMRITPPECMIKSEARLHSNTPIPGDGWMWLTFLKYPTTVLIKGGYGMFQRL